jgi:glycine dehydrogenase
MPGRIVGVTKDRNGKKAYRLTLQAREQHIRREKATSNICTAQALLANVAAAFAIYHGPVGLQRIATRVHNLATTLDRMLQLHAHYRSHFEVVHDIYFDTVCVKFNSPMADTVMQRAAEQGCNLRQLDEYTICVSFDELHDVNDVGKVYTLLTESDPSQSQLLLYHQNPASWTATQVCTRTTSFLQHPTFNSYHSETEMMRYLNRLKNKDYSLVDGMIPLGSCTMKLNPAAAMIPLSWLSVNRIHPFAPPDQTRGYQELFREMEQALAQLTGLDVVSLQPNAGATGEYAGLRAIQAYHQSIGQEQRNVCLIPASAHGTNPASATLAGMRVVIVKCLPDGYIDFSHLCEKLKQHRSELSAIMITYPSTFGIYEEDVKECCELVHEYGGQVYMDGANMNAQIELTSPGEIGADVVHLNLHKTLCVPHGGGGPGVGPIAVREHLAPFLPTHPFASAEITKGDGYVGPLTSGIQGSASILPISWMYLNMMGLKGLRKATEIAVLNANYMMQQLRPYYNVSYRSRDAESCAHEFVIDASPFNKVGIRAEDIAKRLMDYSFHAPTMSWPVKECLMIEPTESESKIEMDRFIKAMIMIREEIEQVEKHHIAYEDSPLYHAPHTMVDMVSEVWDRKYSKESAVYPMDELRGQVHKLWPATNRLDNGWGDRNLFCNCYDFDSVSEDC